MKKANNSKGEKESLLIKLDAELEKLNKNREEIRNSEVFYVVPYKYILYGKNLLEDSGVFQLTTNFAYNTPISLSQKSKITKQACEVPGRFYQSRKVCYQCYQIYSFFMKNLNQPQQTRQKKKVQSRPIKNCYESDIGLINKDNLDDLLLDISYYKLTQKTIPNEKLKNLFASRTEFSISQNESADNSKIHHSKKPSFSFENPETHLNFSFPNKIRRKKRVLSKVAQYYIGKSRIVSRTTFKN